MYRIHEKIEPPELAARQIQFWDRIGAPMSPEVVGYEKDAGKIYYRWIEGHHPCGWMEMSYVYGDLEKLWSISSNETIQAISYCSYVLDRLKDDSIFGKVDDILSEFIDSRPMLHSCLAHGDLTFENILIDQRGRTRLLDPGHPRGLSCRELDEAKLLQSIVVQWETIKYNRSAIPFGLHEAGWMFKVRYEHWVLLLTHLIRILAHPEKHESVVHQYISKVVNEMVNGGFSDPRRFGWDIAEFQAICTRELCSIL